MPTIPLLIFAICFLATRSGTRLKWGGPDRNSELLIVAEAAGFETVITADQNIRYQQDLSGRRLSLVVVSTNHWPTLRGSIGLIVETLGLVTSGSYHEVAVERPARRRRPSPFRPEP